MALQSSSRKLTAAFVALSLLGSSTANAAATARIDPLVALSVFGTAESRAAVCAAGSSAAAAAGAAAAAQAAAPPGCVLPVMDAPPPPVVTETVPPPVAVAPPVASAGIPILPLLLGLAAIAGFAAILLNDDDEGEVNLPISP